ncbi:MAG: hypothetical protein ABIR70_23190 [Bryobacteraceae bacterium]
MWLRAFSILFLAGFAFAQQPGSISTIVGSGVPGSAGDGGSGKLAQLNSPYGVGVDSAGVVYVADWGNNRIRRLQTNDIMQTVAGTGTPLIYKVWDVTADSTGSIYFPDNGPNDTLSRIRKATGPGFAITDFAGTSSGFLGDNGPALSARLSSPVGVALDASGNLYVADLGNNRIRKIDRNGVITTVAGTGNAGFSGDGGQATSAQLNAPHGISIDAAGNLYIADTNNNRVRKVTPAGIISTVAGDGRVPFPADIGDDGPAVTAGLVPWDVEVDTAGNLYISDWLGNRIRKVFANNGVIGTIAGNGVAAFSGDGGPGTSARISAPTGLALDALGNIYFADTGNHRIRKILAPTQGLPIIRTTNPVVPSFMGNAGFSSNMYVEIYGSNFARTARTWTGDDFTGAYAPTSLNGVSVTVNGKPAFIYYVSPGQININVPDDAVTGSVAVQVKTIEGFSNNVTVNRSRLSPTMLTTPQFSIGGKQYVVALTPNFASYIGRPDMIAGASFVTAKPGDLVSIYALGLGATSPATQAGVVASQNSPLLLPLQIKIGGVEAEVPFKGMLANSIGLYQLNVKIPSVAAGDQKIELTVDGIKNEQDLSIVVGP